jgi:diguanylate cyclase (GGDEF)-like protein/PAS domain S-box-containing protein
MDPLDVHDRDRDARLQALERALVESERRFRSFFAKNAAVMLLIEPDSGEIVDANEAASRYYRYPLQRLIGLPITALNTTAPHQVALERQRALHEERNFFRFQHRRADGELRHVEVYSTPIERDGRALLLSIVHDVTGRARNEEALLREQRRLHNLMLASRAGTWEWNYQTDETLYNERWAEILGYRLDALAPLSKNTWTRLTHPSDRQQVSQLLSDYIEGHCEGFECEMRMQHREGHWVWVQARGEIAERTADGEPLWIVGTLLDISQQKLHEQQLERVANYDALTGLPNRLLLADRLGVAMRQMRRREQLLGLVYLDLDGFKEVNDSHGHEVGDRLLIEVAARLRRSLRDNDTLARLGGDEFVAVLVDLPDHDSVQPLLARMLEAVAQPCWLDGLCLNVSASLGVSFYPQAETLDPDQLLRQADQAMYQAKLAGKNGYQLFDAEQDRSMRGLHEQLQRLRQALENEEFVLYYQPKVNMRSGTLLGAEALIRWQHPQRGLLSPASFLPLLEEQPLGIALGEWVMETALAQLSRWQRSGLVVPLSVNLAPNQLLHPEFVPRLQRLLERFPEVAPGRLELEILESSAVHDFERARGVIQACDALGVRVALDDFGIGYSSLTYLRRLPVNALKLDRSFVLDMLHDPDDLAILEGILGMASAFRLEVVAEGVESREHGELLLKLGCQVGQGFHIARPMPAQELPDWAARWEPDPSWRAQATLPLHRRPLLRAIVEHRGWVIAVDDYCHGRSEALPRMETDDCGFGRWLHSDGMATLEPSVAQRLHHLHERIHACAAGVLARAEAGEQQDCGLVVSGLQTLCAELVALLLAEAEKP